METNKGILNQIDKREKPVVPAGFFEQFFDNLMTKIESEDGVLSQLKKTKRPEVPEGFFDQLNVSISSSNEIDNTSVSLLDDFAKTKKPKVDDAFFKGFPDRITEKLVDKPSGSRIISMRILYAVGSIAAIFAILFMFVDFNPNHGRSETAVAPALDAVAEEVIFDDYLAVMDEYELIEYVVEIDVTIEDTTETIDYDNYIDYTEEELLDYYLDL